MQYCTCFYILTSIQLFLIFKQTILRYMLMKVGDRVYMSPMWKYNEAMGTVKQIRKDGYVVVIWDNINGEWHYTSEQAQKLEVINESR